MRKEEAIKEIKEYTIDKLEDFRGYDKVYGCDLHNEIFNTDYYIIGRYKATKWLGEDAFQAIGTIQEYEQSNFGEVFTDLSEPEKVVNMYVYILGEEILQKSNTLSKQWDNLLNDDALQGIIDDLS